jgi:hypothetical protein
MRFTRPPSQKLDENPRIDEAGEVRLGAGRAGMRTRQASFGQYRAPGIRHDRVEPIEQLASRTPVRQVERERESGLGKERSPSDFCVPDVFSTASVGRSCDAATMASSCLTASMPGSGGTTHWYWKKPFPP